MSPSGRPLMSHGEHLTTDPLKLVTWKNMKIYNIPIMLNIEPNSEYSNTLVWWNVKHLTPVIRLKNKRIKNNYSYNNLLMNTEYEKR